MKKTSSSRHALAALGILALVATACSGADDVAETVTENIAETVTENIEPTSAEAGASETEVASGEYCSDDDVAADISVGINNPNYATQLAVVIADERGYFEEEGITDVEILETDDYIAGLIGGSLTIAQGDTDVMFGSAEASGEDIRYLGTYRNGEYQIMGVAPGIEEPEDLIGQPVTGGDLEGRNTSLMQKYLKELGIDPEEVDFVPMGGNSDARLQATIEGTVKAASLFPRHRVPLEEAGGFFMYEEFEINPQEGVMAMGDTVDNDCATVVAFLKATLRARQDMYDFDRKEETLELMRDRGFDIPPYFADEYEVEVEQVSVDGGFDIQEMEDLVTEQTELGNLPEDLDWRQYVQLDPLHKAQEELGVEMNPTDLS